jgi:DNA-binding transcriptional MocR family regulator
MEVLRELYRLMDYKTGRLEPALSTLCKRIKRSRQAVSDALERLEAHGFIKRVRRSEQTFCKGAGPQVRQVTNAYALCMPPSAQRFVEKRLDDGPPARCELDRQEADAAQTRDMLAQATAGEQIRFLAGDAPCTDVLESMLIMIQQRERESTKQGESIPEFYISAGCSRSPKIAKGAPKRVYL